MTMEIINASVIALILFGCSALGIYCALDLKRWFNEDEEE